MWIRQCFFTDLLIFLSNKKKTNFIVEENSYLGSIKKFRFYAFSRNSFTKSDCFLIKFTFPVKNTIASYGDVLTLKTVDQCNFVLGKRITCGERSSTVINFPLCYCQSLNLHKHNTADVMLRFFLRQENCEQIPNQWTYFPRFSFSKNGSFQFFLNRHCSKSQWWASKLLNVDFTYTFKPYVCVHYTYVYISWAEDFQMIFCCNFAILHLLEKTLARIQSIFLFFLFDLVWFIKPNRKFSKNRLQSASYCSCSPPCLDL